MKEIKCEADGEIILKEIKYADQIITFKDGQELKIKYSKFEYEDFITIEYDFGMVVKECCNKEHNCLLHGYRDLDKNPTIKDIVEKTVTFDVEHAFCHPEIDPNYGERHWAISGWLKDRVVISENNDYNSCF